MLAGCAGGPKPAPANNALPSDYQHVAMSVSVLGKGQYRVNGASMPCEQLASVARIRRPSALIIDSIGTIADALCMAGIADELHIQAGTLGADGQIHQIRMVH